MGWPLAKLAAFAGSAVFASVTQSGVSGAFDLNKEVGHCFHGGCDLVWSLNQRIDDGIQSKSESLFGPARDAFIQAMNVLFDQKLNPFLSNVNTDLAARIGQVGDRADKIVAETTTGVLDVIDAAGNLSEKTTGDVQKVILLSFNQADTLENKINSDVSALVEDVDCKVNGTFEGLIDWFRQLVTIPHPTDACYTILGYRFSVPDSIDTINWYRITKCEWTKDLNNSQTVEDVKYNYARLSVLSRRMKCIAQDPIATQLANTDAKTYAESFEIWKLASQ
jgi:hypothetical protein